MITSRRNFIICGSAFCGSALAAPRRSCLGGLNQSLIKGDWYPDTNPYVTSGLLAMWDAEWNVGYREHDDTTLEWIDLAGNGLTMISRGSPSWHENYILATKLEELFYTEETNLFDGIIANGEVTVEVVAEGVIGYNGPKFFLFGGSYGYYGFSVFMSCGDPTRVGFDVGFNNAKTFNYGTHSPKAKQLLRCDGETIFGRYLSHTGSFSRQTAMPALPCKYYKKMCTIGYRNGVSYDGPMIHGEKVFSIRVYDRALSDDEILHNDRIDLRRFGL